MSGAKSLYGWSIVPVFDDDDSVLGWDVMEPGTDSSDEPWAELVETVTAAKDIIRMEVWYRRIESRMMREGAR